MSTIETNKPTRQNTTIGYDYVVPAGLIWERSSQNSRQRTKEREIEWQRASAVVFRHFFPAIFPLSQAGQTYPLFEQPGPGEQLLSFVLWTTEFYPRFNYPWDCKFIPGRGGGGGGSDGETYFIPKKSQFQNLPIQKNHCFFSIPKKIP